jgi:hypothetical protein
MPFAIRVCAGGEQFLRSTISLFLVVSVDWDYGDLVNKCFCLLWAYSLKHKSIEV